MANLQKWIANHEHDAAYLTKVRPNWTANIQAHKDRAQALRRMLADEQNRQALAAQYAADMEHERQMAMAEGQLAIFSYGWGMATGDLAGRWLSAVARRYAAEATRRSVMAANEYARQQMVLAKQAAEAAKQKAAADAANAAAAQRPMVASVDDWVAPQGFRSPKNGGTWSGTRANSQWTPNNPADLDLQPGDSVPFRRGRPDFSKWTRESLDVPGMTGHHDHDMPLIHREIARKKGWMHNGKPNAAAAERWLKQEGLTPHHDKGTNVQLVPTKLHEGVPHQGSAAEMRKGN